MSGQRRLTHRAIAVAAAAGSAVLLGVFFARAAPSPMSLTASLDPPVIPLGAQARLELRFQNCAPATVPEIPAVAGLQIRFLGQGSETTIVNGNVQRALVLSYLVQPDRAGSYTIPALRVAVEGATVVSQPLRLQVTQANAQPGQAQPLILTLSFPKSTFYVGEPTMATVSLFSRYASYQIPQLPALSVDGAVVGTNVPLAGTQTVATNNAAYRLETWGVPVTFVKTGNLKVSAEDCQVAVRFRSQRSRDPFGFPSLFPEIETRRFTVSSQPITVAVRPLPAANVPPEFTGAVGQFTLDASVSSTNVTAGDPLTLEVRLSGQGNLESLRWSAPSNWTGFRLYEPTSTLTVSDALGHSGAKTVEQVVIPESTAVRAVPPIRFAFFDPVQEEYKTLEHAGFPLSVLAPTAPNAQPTLVRTADTEADRRATDIVHIKSRPGHLAFTAPPLITRPVFLVLFMTPLLAWAFSLGLRRRVELLAANPRHVRNREVARRLKTGLATLQTRARGGQVQEFYSALFRLLQEVLGERLDLPAASITGEIVDQRLRAAGVQANLTDAVERLFAQCDQARYAPEAITGTLESACSEAEQTLRQLRELEVTDGH